MGNTFKLVVFTTFFLCCLEIKAQGGSSQNGRLDWSEGQIGGSSQNGGQIGGSSQNGGEIGGSSQTGGQPGGSSQTGGSIGGSSQTGRQVEGTNGIQPVGISLSLLILTIFPFFLH